MTKPPRTVLISGMPLERAKVENLTTKKLAVEAKRIWAGQYDSNVAQTTSGRLTEKMTKMMYSVT